MAQSPSLVLTRSPCPVFCTGNRMLRREKIGFLAPDSGSITDNDAMAVYVSRAIKDAGGAPDVVTGYASTCPLQSVALKRA